MISTRAKSPTRAEAIARALKPGPVYSNGVLIRNWVEDRIECPKGGTLYFPPKEEIDYEKLKPELRQPDFRLNKLNGLRGNVENIYRHDSHDKCGNFTTTTDLVYNHLPKPLCGPIQRYYKRCKHQFYPQPDLMQCFMTDLVYNHLPKSLCKSIQRYYKRCKHQFYPQPDNMQFFGNKTEWGLKKYKQHEWACTDVSDYASTLYEDTFVPPRPHQYLSRCERKARNSKFTKEFRYSMLKPLAKPKQKKQ